MTQHFCSYTLEDLLMEMPARTPEVADRHAYLNPCGFLYMAERYNVLEETATTLVARSVLGKCRFQKTPDGLLVLDSGPLKGQKFFEVPLEETITRIEQGLMNDHLRRFIRARQKWMTALDRKGHHSV